MIISPAQSVRIGLCATGRVGPVRRLEPNFFGEVSERRPWALKSSGTELGGRRAIQVGVKVNFLNDQIQPMCRGAGPANQALAMVM